MFRPTTPAAGGAYPGSSLPWDSQESVRHSARTPTPRKISGMSPVDEGTPPKNVAESWIADKVDIDEIVKIGSLEELVPSFVFTTDKEHEELDMEPADLVQKTIGISEQILSDFEKSYQAVIAKVVASSISYSSSQTEEGSEIEEPQVISVAGRAKMAVADEFRKLAMDQLPDVVSPLLDLIFEQYYRPIVDDTLQKSVEAAKAKCLLKFHQAAKDISQVEQSAAESAVEAQSAAESQSRIVFNACVKQLQELYSSYTLVKIQYDQEMANVAVISDSLHLSSIPVASSSVTASAAEKDQKIQDFAEGRKRAEALKSIMEFKFDAIIQCIYAHYPDIAGSASSSSSKKGYALHEYKLPAGILGDTHDPKIASSMIAGLLQIAQAWIEDFFVLVVFLKRIQDNESPFEPVFAPSIEEMRHFLGPDLGDLAVKQMGKMWSVVARGNQDIVEFNRNNPSVSMFKQITTGGNGEPERKSTVEPKNIISFVCYCVHHHDQGLSDRRRQMTAVMKNAYSLLAEGCIIKACDQLQKHWAQAMELKVKVDWYSLIHLGSDILRHRSPDFWEKLTQWIESAMRDVYCEDCLPKVNEWVADIKAIALRLTNSAPRKYVTQEITAARASLQAFNDVLDGRSIKSNHVDTSAKSDWDCGNVDCKEKIPQAVVDGFLQRRAKKGITDKSPPSVMSLLCSECHEKHSKGNDVILSDGNAKKHYQVLSDQEKADAKKAEEKKAKNKAKNARRKARKAEAKKKAQEEEAAKAAGNSNADEPAEASSNDSVSMMRKLNETMEALPGKLAALAAANVVKTADAAEAGDQDVNASKNDAAHQGGEASSSVIQKLLGAYERSAPKVSFDEQVSVKSYACDQQEQLYVPK